jgi:NitT/TauT family transport system substrate-binding protein
MSESATAKGLTRRGFLSKASALGAASLLGLVRPAWSEPGPKSSRIRLLHSPNFCLAPQDLAEKFLRMEGFTEFEYVENSGGGVWTELLGSGLFDFTMDTAPAVIAGLDRRLPIVALAGIHAGCYELFAHPVIRSVVGLKGKRIAILSRGGGDHIFLSSIAAWVGLRQRDVQWVESGSFARSASMFSEGKVDAFLAFPPQPQELRAKKIDHVIVNTTQDRPWSQYFCCMVIGNRDFVEKHPVATKRVLRAYLKAADICASDPERVARYFATQGYESRYDLTLEVVKSLPYNRWRQAEPEDTLRFHALRLHEAEIIKTNPQKLIVQGTDWRFLNKLKKEMKA